MGTLEVAVIGAGPAGLTAAYALAQRGCRPQVFESSKYVGGISRTEQYRGYRFDIGGHRFFTKVGVVNDLWREILGNEFRRVPRLSRIFFRGRFYPYPLVVGQTLRNLGPVESLRILGSYLAARVRPTTNEETLEQWVTNRFGDRLYRLFFKTYTEKVWGIPCHQIRADWAAQRIKGLSLASAVRSALGIGGKGVKSLIHEFDYPRLGPGQMWEACRDRVEDLGGTVRMNAEITRLHHRGDHITAVETADGESLSVDAVISSMPIGHLIERLSPTPPPEVLAAARGLRYRDFLIVALILDGDSLFPDNWIYVHDPTVQVGRIQNFKNWSADLVPDPATTCLGMEYFCSETDDLWGWDDARLIAYAREELARLGLASAEVVRDGCVLRQKKAYPVYDEEYRAHLNVLRDYLKTFTNLHTVGRNGMHRYNNQDHSMLTALLAVENLFGADHDLWEVNTERSYHEDFELKRASVK
jgi:protoporphyrinogen oxidase